MDITKEKSLHIRELDGIRGVAILMVLIWHYVSCVPINLETGTLLYYLHYPTALFWSGVDLFFVLSGFLIGGIIIDHHRNPRFLKVFWIRRTCRILPALVLLYLMCLLASIFMDRSRFSWLLADLLPWWSYATFTQNILMGLRGEFGGNFLGITWSLAVEEQFYLFAPMMILLLGQKWWVRILIPMILLSILLRTVIPGFHTYVNTIFRMDSLLAGVLIAVIYRNPRIWKIAVSYRNSLMIVFLLMIIFTGILKITGKFETPWFAWFAFLYALFLVVILINSSSTITWIFRSKFLCFFGSIAYGLYIYHQAIAGLLHGWRRNGQAPSLMGIHSVVVTVCALFLSIIFSYISWRCFESRFVRIGKLYKY